jgi:hypothetical protein
VTARFLSRSATDRKTLPVVGSGLKAAVLQQQEDRLAERFQRLLLGEPLAVALREFRGERDQPFPIAHDARREDGRRFHVGDVHLPAVCRKSGLIPLAATISGGNGLSNCRLRFLVCRARNPPAEVPCASENLCRNARS